MNLALIWNDAAGPRCGQLYNRPWRLRRIGAPLRRADTAITTFSGADASAAQNVVQTTVELAAAVGARPKPIWPLLAIIGGFLASLAWTGFFAWTVLLYLVSL
jgi:hypothetical protein